MKTRVDCDDNDDKDDNGSSVNDDDGVNDIHEQGYDDCGADSE